MEIDIIDYTEERLEAMSKKRFSRVLKAQLKKNRLLRDFEEKLEKERNRLISNGSFVSELFNLTEDKLYQACIEEIEVVKAELEVYLLETAGEDGSGGNPYLVDFTLSPVERMNIVKGYYLNAFVDAQERLDAFKADNVAKEYLGEYYASLYDYFLGLL